MWIIYYATKNFKLFKVNIDNNEKMGMSMWFMLKGIKLQILININIPMAVTSFLI